MKSMRTQSIDEFRSHYEKIIRAANAKLDELVRNYDELFGPEGDWERPRPVLFSGTHLKQERD